VFVIFGVMTRARPVLVSLLAFAVALVNPAWITAAWAHPHIWITMHETILFSPEGKLSGIRHQWIFDEAYSTFAVQGLDPNGDGKIPNEVLDGLAKTNTEALEEFDYFTAVKMDGKTLPLDKPRDYHFSFDGKNLTYTVTMPLKDAVKPGKTTIFEIDDPTWFISFAFEGGAAPVTLGDNAPHCSAMATRPAADAQPSQNLSEGFFNSLGASSTFGTQFASHAIVACP
jgi:ABC-type uncharacterized transport system substrate-binding protein